MPAEFDFIAWLRAQRTAAPSFATVGIGDDLAVLRLPADDLVLVGADQVLDGVHFDSAVHPPRAIGRKAMNRNLSDCAAMACLPAAAVATLALPRGVGVDYARELYLGMAEASAPFGCEVVGGDTGSWPGRLVVTVTVLGRSAGVAPITRTGANPGDGVFVTGPLGGSIGGRHMTFAPRVGWGRGLGRTGRVTAMIDLSDGLSRDLRHLCDDGRLGAVVRADRVPIHADAVPPQPFGRRPPLDRALHDGEDYELLFTAPVPPDAASVGFLLDGESLSFACVGRMTAEPGVWLEHADGRREPLDPQSWEHAL